MEIWDFSRRMFAIGAAAAFLAGCGALRQAQENALPSGATGTMPQRRTAASHVGHKGSWMLPEAASDDLVYVSDETAMIWVYSYPQGVLVGALQGFDLPGGPCVDAAQNVWIPDAIEQNLTEFAHGDSYPIGTIGDSGYTPRDCAIDPTTGNLAVINSGSKSFGPGNVAIYRGAQGTPTYYTDPNIAFYTFGSYDQNGNLYVDGSSGDSPPVFHLAVLPKGSGTFTDISVKVRLERRSAPGLFWDGKYLALSNGGKKVYRLRIDGSTAKRKRLIRLEQTQGGLGAIWIDGNHIIGNGEASANIWKYPEGGEPVTKLPISTYATGAAVSNGRTRTAYKTVYAFLGGEYGPDGVNPTGGVVSANGLIYGTTSAGGATTWGTLFGITPSGTENVLYNFHGAGDASTPMAGLTLLNGTLYGTALRGGARYKGAVFSMTPSGSERVVYSFTGGAGGDSPYGGLITVNGALYGTTSNGGDHQYGMVFKLTPDGHETTLYSFKGSSDGAYPQASLTYSGGSLYGTTTEGGASNHGTAFKMSLQGNERFVYSFTGGNDGEDPQSGLTELNGLLYGTTYRGGASGDGTVYSLTTTGSESVVYAFKGKLDGSAPMGGLTALHGVLYGTASRGGFNLLFGTAFKLTTHGDLTVVHAFSDLPDGAYPESPLTLIGGKLYGTALEGGTDCPGYGCGTVFRFKP